MDVMSYSDSMSEHTWQTSEPETGIEAESKKLPSSKFKGVVPQPNGRWGAQIYEKHQRVWLGTFNGEEQAAIAYDVAAKRFRGGDAVTNFTAGGGGDDEHEAFFLYTHSKAEIVDMLRKHTYTNELEQSKFNDLCHGGGAGNGFSGRPGYVQEEDSGREHLFEKVATPSDIGKLNRMVIPKQQAERHLPLEVECASKGVSLNLVDIDVGKVWRFRYCYWRSSQSYVLTKGWSSFVKEKKLKAGDVVSFWRSAGCDGRLFIDARRRGLEEMSGQDDPTRVIRLFGVDIS